MRLFIVRHADPRGDEDDLTPAGRRQAEALAGTFKQIGLDAIFTSPLERAKATARPTSGLLGLDPITQDWMAERDWLIDHAPCGRRSAWNLAGEVIRSGDYVLPCFVDQGAEDLGRASDAFLRDLGYERAGRRYRAVQSNEKNVAVFAHLGFGLTWLSYLLDLPLALVWCGFWLDPCSVTTVHFEQRSSEWAVPRCLSMGETAHLRDAGVPVVPSSIHTKFRRARADPADF